MATRVPLSSLQVPANPSNAELLNTIKEAFAVIDNRLKTLDNRLKTLDNRLKTLESTQNPMSDDRIYHMPVIGGETHQLTDPTQKQATYTWLEYAPGEYCLVGSAHCAITLALPTADSIFVELPPEVTSLGVESIYLVDPYASDFTNPLPTPKDIIVISVRSSPPTGIHMPKFSPVTPDKVKQQRTAGVVGRALGSVVSSRAGILISESNSHSGGRLQFMLDLGEPADSGTLLHVKDENGDFHARAVFCGIVPNLNPQFSRRGQGAMLPMPHSLTRLPVVAHNLIPAQQTIQVRFFSNNVGSSPGLQDTACKIVPSTQFGPNAVELTNGFDTAKRGLLVKSVKPIHYIGAMDHFRMSGQV